ncbi:hypothetical protein BSU01_14285 [Erwinia billingiae]|nr:hypothetical protein [Erwinia billingiae]
MQSNKESLEQDRSSFQKLRNSILLLRVLIIERQSYQVINEFISTIDAEIASLQEQNTRR